MLAGCIEFTKAFTQSATPCSLRTAIAWRRFSPAAKRQFCLIDQLPHSGDFGKTVAVASMSLPRDAEGGFRRASMLTGMGSWQPPIKPR